jgi:SAM-dependent methyltransferase
MSSNVQQDSAFATNELATELALFDRAATGWKEYWGSFVRPYVHGRVLEVGAGNGGSIPYLVEGASEWLCLKPDPRLAARLSTEIASGALPSRCRLEVKTLRDLPHDQLFDAILYIDVMEHLADHDQEAALATEHLTPGGMLIILSPAHQFLFSPFDQAVGHHRRYSRKSLATIVPSPLEQVKLIYLDSLGMLLSLGNRFVLRSARPNEGLCGSGTTGLSRSPAGLTA